MKKVRKIKVSAITQCGIAIADVNYRNDKEGSIGRWGCRPGAMLTSKISKPKQREQNGKDKPKSQTDKNCQSAYIYYR